MQKTTVMLNGVNLERLAGTIEATIADPKLAKFHFSLNNQWVDGGYNQSVIGDFYGAGKIQERETPFILANDEAEVLLGKDNAPNPVEYVLHALAGCVTTSMVYHAAARGYEIRKVTTTVEGDLDLRGFLGIDATVRKGYDNIKISFDIEGDFNEEEKLEILNLTSFSPVLDIVSNGVPVKISLGSKQDAEMVVG
ncbi:MAG TPA: OsmC family protein [Chitinophagaceae bacterium]|nr:OsmC family protein [Chitinophagaceae bacterium]